MRQAKQQEAMRKCTVFFSCFAITKVLISNCERPPTKMTELTIYPYKQCTFDIRNVYKNYIIEETGV